jgi:uncharacterized membrane protein
MDRELVFLHFESIPAAERAMGTIRTLEAEGFLTLDDAAIVTRSDDGWVSVKPLGRTGLGKKAVLGGVLGVITGGLIGLPMIGGAIGAGAAAKQSSSNDQFDELMNTVGRNMTAGTAVLALTVAALTDPWMVTDRLEVHRDRLIRAEVPASIRAQLEDTGNGG